MMALFVLYPLLKQSPAHLTIVLYTQKEIANRCNLFLRFRMGLNQRPPD